MAYNEPGTHCGRHMSTDCIFCKIARGEIKSDVFFRDDTIMVLRDISPQAPSHLLVMPLEHMPSVREITDANALLIGRMVVKANQVAAREGVADRGYRLAINCGVEGGQSVGHLHMHVLGGRQLSGKLG